MLNLTGIALVLSLPKWEPEPTIYVWIVYSESDPRKRNGVERVGDENRILIEKGHGLLTVDVGVTVPLGALWGAM